MGTKDKELIAKAELLEFVDWSDAYLLAEKADSNEAKLILESIAKRLYHIEEFKSDLC